MVGTEAARCEHGGLGAWRTPWGVPWNRLHGHEKPACCMSPRACKLLIAMLRNQATTHVDPAVGAHGAQRHQVALPVGGGLGRARQRGGRRRGGRLAIEACPQQSRLQVACAGDCTSSKQCGAEGHEGCDRRAAGTVSAAGAHAASARQHDVVAQGAAGCAPPVSNPEPRPCSRPELSVRRDLMEESLL